MPYEFEPHKLYRMPTHFGPSLGPRQGPGGRTFACVDNPKSTTVSVSFLSNSDQLSALLPPGFTLDGEPVVTVYATYMTEIEWLAGRGYNVVGVTIPVVYEGKETARGPFLTILWENLADPIITGREDIGYSKIYCEIPELRCFDGRINCLASWLGFSFLDLSVTDLNQDDSEMVSPVGDGILHYKYIPKTGEWDQADCAYAVITPAGGSRVRVLESWKGEGTIHWHRSRWEDLPTFYNVVNTFADLEVQQMSDASVTKTIGGRDLRDQRILG
ncbi:MAG: acetoacetate decarboxylase family protein [Candidatus Latescibacterota bacterium]|nr:acetoacetate decarboxylase family protein [Candidatus Latescibacterota bacterium]